MKKRLLMIPILASMLLGTKVYAKEATLSVDKSTVTSGGNFTVKVQANTSAWTFKVASTGPVDTSKCIINEADSTSDGNDKLQTFQVTCTTTGTGKVELVLTGDNTDQNNDFYQYKDECDDDTAKNCSTTGTNTSLKATVNVVEGQGSTSNQETTGDTNTQGTVTKTDDPKKENVSNPKTGVYSYIILIPIILLVGYVAIKRLRAKSLFR